ncbi:MAG TPA: DNA-binding domain-containing protein [Vicinamibacteria bacterium]
MAPPLPLDRLQRWMQAVIVHPGDAASAPRAALARGEAPGARVADLVRPSARLTAAERVGIYHDMYLLRMEEALATDYPALRHLLGERGFLDLVRGYVRAYPSRHFSLNRLGDHLPEYVARDARLKRRAFCHDLARLERALALVFDAPQTPPLGADAVAAVPGERWEGARLVPVAAFALLAFRYPVGAYADSVRDDEGHEHPPLRRADTWAVVYRRDYSVWRQDLSRAGYHVLRELASGRTVGEAVASALRIRARDRPTERGLFRLFRGWMAAGLFQGIEL